MAPARYTACSGWHPHPGWNLQAQVAIPAWDRDGLEKLIRYAARPPLSMERLSVASDGRVAYRLKYPGRRGETHRLMEPMEFLARIASLVPPPRHPLHVFAGVLAPHSSWRKLVVPVATTHDGCTHASPVGDPAGAGRSAGPAGPVAPKALGAGPAGNVPSPPGDAHDPLHVAGDPPPGAQAPSGSRVVTAAAAGAGRMRSGASKLTWSDLLRRTYGVEVLRCVRCGGAVRLIATIMQPAVAKAILDHVGLPSDVPALRRARAPDLWAEA